MPYHAYPPYPFFLYHLYLALCGSSRTFKAWELLNRLGLPRSHGKPSWLKKSSLCRPLTAAYCTNVNVHPLSSIFKWFQMIALDLINIIQQPHPNNSRVFRRFASQVPSNSQFPRSILAASRGHTHLPPRCRLQHLDWAKSSMWRAASEAPSPRYSCSWQFEGTSITNIYSCNSWYPGGNKYGNNLGLPPAMSEIQSWILCFSMFFSVEKTWKNMAFPMDSFFKEPTGSAFHRRWWQRLWPPSLVGATSAPTFDPGASETEEIAFGPTLRKTQDPKWKDGGNDDQPAINHEMVCLSRSHF